MVILFLVQVCREPLIIATPATASGANARDAQPDPIEPRLRRQVAHPAVVVTPGHVVRVLGSSKRPEVLPR